MASPQALPEAPSEPVQLPFAGLGRRAGGLFRRLSDFRLRLPATSLNDAEPSRRRALETRPSGGSGRGLRSNGSQGETGHAGPHPFPH